RLLQQGQSVAIAFGVGSRREGLLQVILEIRTLDWQGQRIGSPTKDESLLILAVPPRQRIDSVDHGLRKTIETEAIKRPALGLFDDVMEIGDRAERRFDPHRDTLAMLDIGAAVFAHLAAMRVRGNPDGADKDMILRQIV